jgi:competence protein ComEA
MNFSRFFELDKKLMVKVIAGVILIAVALTFYLAKNKAADDDLTVSVIPDSEQEAVVQSTDSAIAEGGTIMVDVAGAVLKPSVVELPQGSRVFEAVEKAGGLTTEADTRAINQAEILTDGQKIYIPTKQEIKESGSSGGYSVNADSITGQSGLININTADSASLQAIPGVGPATADKIIGYRNENGKFKKIEDIKNVSGIGDKTFEKMKKKITV